MAGLDWSCSPGLPLFGLPLNRERTRSCFGDPKAMAALPSQNMRSPWRAKSRPRRKQIAVLGLPMRDAKASYGDVILCLAAIGRGEA